MKNESKQGHMCERQRVEEMCFKEKEELWVLRWRRALWSLKNWKKAKVGGVKWAAEKINLQEGVGLINMWLFKAMLSVWDLILVSIRSHEINEQVT